jgi:hypothetical protein
VNGKKQRLELTWIGKDERPKLEPRILLEDPDRSYTRKVGEDDFFDNKLIFGDNLLGNVDKPSPHAQASQQDKAQETRFGLVEACGDAAHFLQMADTVFDARP